jgi:hypothetical protein
MIEGVIGALIFAAGALFGAVVSSQSEGTDD